MPTASPPDRRIESALSEVRTAAPFVRAADLLERSPWRERLVAATMLELSKTALQAEGDVIAESADMIRAGVANFLAVADVQPDSPDGVRNHLDYRPLEGFVFAVSPFNYASMNHLASAPPCSATLWCGSRPRPPRWSRT